MAHHIRVSDPRDPAGVHHLHVEYEARWGRADPSVGWRAPLEIEVLSARTKRDRDITDRLNPAQLAQIEEKIYGRHAE